VSVCQIYDGSDHPDSDSLQRRRSRGRLSDSASTLSAAPRRLQSLLIRGGGAPDIHVPLIASGGHGQNPAVAEAGGISPKQTGENVATVEAADRSREAPETTGSRRAAPEQVSKRAAPEQGMSDRPVKKAQVRSKM
jgi:hypothetical protein